MPKNLVIVESPAKAKTIENYLGKDFVVKSSYGHVRDLPKHNQAIDIQNNFEPTYEISEDKQQVIKELRRIAEDAETIWLATDDDREGEAISWHLKEALELDTRKVKRIVFREITKTAILQAIQKPRSIDDHLVEAQQARRILDRIVGFELSPVLWKKVKFGLSAGRVQSAAVRVVVEREMEIEKFDSEAYFRLQAEFEAEKRSLQAELSRRLENEGQAQGFLQGCKSAIFRVENLEKKAVKKSPTPPFTTSTLQQEASRKLGYSVGQTMSLAQRLYEAGHISYMRTDSVSLSKEARNNAAAAIEQSYGAKYVHSRQYTTKSSSAQEAHEAIRPTNFAAREVGADAQQKRLYDLIWKRAIASQMADADIERTIVTISIEKDKEIAKTASLPLPADKFKATGEVILFDGFLRVYLESTDEEEDDEAKNVIPPLQIGQVLDLNFMKATESFTRPKPRYTEAALVKALEELGIGRPSTYAPTISTILKREYVVKESREGKKRPYKELTLKENQIKTQVKTEMTGAEKNKLFPTDLGIMVNTFLTQHFSNIIDLSFTAQVEEQFDHIAEGKLKWRDMLRFFYQDFHPQVQKVEENADFASAANSRNLGTDPKTGRSVIARMGRYGALVELKSEEEDEKSQFASLKKGQYLNSITLEEALELFKLPRTVGEYEGKEMVAAVGRFGPYIRHDSKFYSIPKEKDPLAISQEEGIEIIEAKRKADAQKNILDFPENPDVKVLNGRYGPYIAYQGQNIKIPKDKVPSELTLAECLELIEKSPKKPTKAIAKPTKVATKATKATDAKAKKAPAKRVSKKAATEPKTVAKKATVKKTTAKAKTEKKK
ncbi:type I DNA topoisomerase [Hugenholtzia roseola]|uniref:type I DNA topoisomerase n=1 Tax=Hugenholtzia roseola TaxID=1002 RepID=UPI0003F9DB3D|nr:type I DNA topoisomerase [Hugenholtzia roseola]